MSGRYRLRKRLDDFSSRFLFFLMENLYAPVYHCSEEDPTVPHSKKKTILVCIDDHPKTFTLLKEAANQAREAGCRWSVLHVTTPDDSLSPRDRKETLMSFITAAQHMGADIFEVENASVRLGITGFILDALREGREINRVIVGYSAKEGLFTGFRTPLAEHLARDLRDRCVVQIVPLSGTNYETTWRERLRLPQISLKNILYAVIATFLAYLGAEAILSFVPTIERQLNTYNVALLFLMASSITALRQGLIAGLLSAIIGFMIINYEYIRPFHSFSINSSADGIGMILFLTSAIIMSILGGVSRAQSTAGLQREKRSEALFRIHRLSSDAENREQALKIIMNELDDLLHMEVAFFFPPPLSDEISEESFPVPIHLDDKDRESLESCWEHLQSTGFGTFYKFDTAWRFEPLVTPKGPLGVMGVKIPLKLRFDTSFGRLLTALADQVAAILERIELTKMMSDSRIREEREKLRALLLSSVSHDLKTPLASVIGALSVYQRIRDAGRLKPEQADELIETALDEAQRLDSFISNILDMTRIESGEITFDRDWHNPADILNSVTKRLRQRLRRHKLSVQTPENSMMVHVDLLMTEQVLQNIIDNAVKYSPEGGDIIVEYGAEEKNFFFRIRDFGPGIPEDKQEAIFDKYERLRMSDSQVAGTGLGLAICKAIMEKQDGWISVGNHEQGGAEFTLWFPDMKPDAENSIFEYTEYPDKNDTKGAGADGNRGVQERSNEL
ncbi:ATP-binding protein [Emcibacter sp.]|uniref:ATP-binding protein n=1 Tax=Emcibacter sp. TaxID=1979954 RepID=UPI003A8F1404